MAWYSISPVLERQVSTVGSRKGLECLNISGRRKRFGSRDQSGCADSQLDHGNTASKSLAKRQKTFPSLSASLKSFRKKSLQTSMSRQIPIQVISGARRRLWDRCRRPKLQKHSTHASSGAGRHHCTSLHTSAFLRLGSAASGASLKCFPSRDPVTQSACSAVSPTSQKSSPLPPKKSRKTLGIPMGSTRITEVFRAFMRGGNAGQHQPGLLPPSEFHAAGLVADLKEHPFMCSTHDSGMDIAKIKPIRLYL